MALPGIPRSFGATIRPKTSTTPQFSSTVKGGVAVYALGRNMVATPPNWERSMANQVVSPPSAGSRNEPSIPVRTVSGGLSRRSAVSERGTPEGSINIPAIPGDGSAEGDTTVAGASVLAVCALVSLVSGRSSGAASVFADSA